MEANALTRRKRERGEDGCCDACKVGECCGSLGKFIKTITGAGFKGTDKPVGRAQCMIVVAFWSIVMCQIAIYPTLVALGGTFLSFWYIWFACIERKKNAASERLDRLLQEHNASQDGKFAWCWAFFHLHAVELRPVYQYLLGLVSLSVAIQKKGDNNQVSSFWVVPFLLLCIVPALLILCCLPAMAMSKGILRHGFGSGQYISFTLGWRRHNVVWRSLSKWLAATGVVICIFGMCASLNPTKTIDMICRCFIIMSSSYQLIGDGQDIESWVDVGIDEFKFNRSATALFTESNAAFEAKLLRALWEAENGHWEILQKMMKHDSPLEAAEALLEVVKKREQDEGKNAEDEHTVEIPLYASLCMCCCSSLCFFFIVLVLMAACMGDG